MEKQRVLARRLENQLSLLLCPTPLPSSLYYFAEQSHSEQAEQNDVNVEQETVLNLLVVVLILNVEPVYQAQNCYKS